MITDDVRREVAARMREVAESHKDDLNDDPDYSPFVAFNVFSSAFDRFPRYKDLLHLADLIDRPAYRPVIPNAMEGYVFYPQCGAEIGEYGVPNYCHSCGVAIHNG